ncbi:hypothetical protein P5673_004884, partial [Acropora cervicornis]
HEMNLLKRKRKTDREHKENTKEIQPAIGENIRLKVTLALNALTGRSYTQNTISIIHNPSWPSEICKICDDST